MHDLMKKKRNGRERDLQILKRRESDELKGGGGSRVDIRKQNIIFNNQLGDL